MIQPYTFDPSKPAAPADEVDDTTKTVGQIAAEVTPIIFEHTDAKTDRKIEPYHVSNLITNLLHLCDAMCFDQDEVLDRARRAWQNER